MLSTRTSLAMLAPINTLPDDVVVEILRTAYLHHSPHCRADNGFYTTNFPIAFSQVCRCPRNGHAVDMRPRHAVTVEGPL